jgi:hypothetical protein
MVTQSPRPGDLGGPRAAFSLSVEKFIPDLFPLETRPKKPRFFGRVDRRIQRRGTFSTAC